jgi:chromosome segregation ATPase
MNNIVQLRPEPVEGGMLHKQLAAMRKAIADQKARMATYTGDKGPAERRLAAMEAQLEEINARLRRAS